MARNKITLEIMLFIFCKGDHGSSYGTVSKKRGSEARHVPILMFCEKKKSFLSKEYRFKSYVKITDYLNFVSRKRTL